MRPTELSAEPERPRLPPSGTLQPDSGIVGAGARGKFELMSARATRTRDLKRQTLRRRSLPILPFRRPDCPGCSNAQVGRH